MCCIKKLAEAGFMINLAKCTFLTDSLQVVGMEVIRGIYRAKAGKLSALMGCAIPTTTKALQKLAGSLNYFKRFVPGYAALFQPIKALMSSKTSPIWTQECHRALERICETLSRHLTLTIANPALPYHLYIDVSPDGVAGILCQEVTDRHAPIHFIGRELSDLEKGLSYPEALLSATSWAMRKLRIYVEF